MDDGLENDPDWIRAKREAERNDPLYWLKLSIQEIQVQLTYGIPTLKFLGWVIVILLGIILWRVWPLGT